jgi:hypothetical protein
VKRILFLFESENSMEIDKNPIDFRQQYKVYSQQLKQIQMYKYYSVIT